MKISGLRKILVKISIIFLFIFNAPLLLAENLTPRSIPVGFQEAGEARASSRSGAYTKYVSSETSTQQSQNLKGDGYIHPNQPFPKPINDFINHMVNYYHFDRDQLNSIMSQAEIIPPVIHSIEKPTEIEPWDFYRHIFLTQARISQGAAYWRLHQKVLKEAERIYGVDPSIIVAIIGVESMYGQEKEHYQELGALATLAFYHQARSTFFEKELEQYFLLAREYHFSPLVLRGSYAGALGIPQFMPDSYRSFAVSLLHQPQINLLTNHDDAILSIANFLSRKGGWIPSQPIASPVRMNSHIPPAWLVSASANPTYPIQLFNKYGITAQNKLSKNQKTALIAMHNTHNDEYWLVFPNFHAIMSYNPRTTYALAVYQLSRAIQEAYEH